MKTLTPSIIAFPKKALRYAKSRKQFKKQLGVSLLETIFALAIVTIGLVGSLKLFSNSIKGTNSADMNIIASELSTQLIERMRSNVAGATAYNISGLSTCTSQLQCIQTSTSPVITCSPIEMGAFDLQQISCENGIADNLPSGNLTINCAGVTPAECTIAISWQGPTDQSPRTITNNIILGGL